MSPLDQFAELLIKLVRDEAISSCDSMLQPHAVSPRAKNWANAAKDGDLAKIGRVMIPDCVDATIFRLLDAIDNGHISLLFKSSSGEMIDLTRDGKGELGGWLLGADGWCERFSRQRVNDYLADYKRELENMDWDSDDPEGSESK